MAWVWPVPMAMAPEICSNRQEWVDRVVAAPEVPVAARAVASQVGGLAARVAEALQVVSEADEVRVGSADLAASGDQVVGVAVAITAAAPERQPERAAPAADRNGWGAVARSPSATAAATRVLSTWAA